MRWPRAFVLAALLAAPGAGALEVGEHPLLVGLRDKLVAEGIYERAELDALLADATLDPRVTEALSKPAERLPWYRYRPIFVTPERAAQGIAFWRRHAATLRRAQETYGVPPHVVTAIIGVETRYGAHAGRHRVLDALATLGLSEHPRAAFFFRELEALLRLVREERLDARSLVGSYAGAMGMPQFIPSSYRAYAVDFDGDGRRDLLRSPADAIGSVGHYLAAHGWAPGTPVVVPARVSVPAAAPVSAELDHTLAELAEAGAVADTAVALDPQARALLVILEGERGPEYHLGLQNFYAITRYNRSPLYAMAVHELAEAIEAGVERAP
jgi:membrane-bound lytic murein transglycosylase B